MSALTTNTTIQTIKAAEFKKMRILVPPMPKQKAFREYFAATRYIEIDQARRWQMLEDLFAVLLHRAFTGVLTAKWREAHMKELLAEMESQVKALDCPPTKSNLPTAVRNEEIRGTHEG
jgi:type I restriction enzyme S subunit